MACCAPCSMDRALAAAARPETAMSGILPTVVWPSDVVAYKRKLEPDFDATNQAVKACNAANPQTASADVFAAWAAFYASWQQFDAEAVPTFGSANKYDEAVSYEQRLAAWQQKLVAGGCSLSAPIVTPPSDETTVTAAKWIAIAVVAGAVAYGVHSVVPFFRRGA